MELGIIILILLHVLNCFYCYYYKKVTLLLINLRIVNYFVDLVTMHFQLNDVLC